MGEGGSGGHEDAGGGADEGEEGEAQDAAGEGAGGLLVGGKGGCGSIVWISVRRGSVDRVYDFRACWRVRVDRPAVVLLLRKGGNFEPWKRRSLSAAVDRICGTTDLEKDLKL